MGTRIACDPAHDGPLPRGRHLARSYRSSLPVSTEKFLAYFLLIAFYMVYARFADIPPHGPDHGQAVASMPAPTAQAGTRSAH